jgi:hypothetical protein
MDKAPADPRQLVLQPDELDFISHERECRTPPVEPRRDVASAADACVRPSHPDENPHSRRERVLPSRCGILRKRQSYRTCRRVRFRPPWLTHTDAAVALRLVRKVELIEPAPRRGPVTR